MGKGVLVEISSMSELAANHNQGRVQMLYTYIGLSLNLAISTIECYQLFCIYIETNGCCSVEYKSRKAGCYCVLLLIICYSAQVGMMY